MQLTKINQYVHKSSLLQAILGELMPTSGSCRVHGKLAYASQDPWILPATVQENILCGLKMEHERYDRVVQACSLNEDLRIFPHGDCTEVGERGISLSGGQKARINLARALYVQADIYLLDDPLSAVDAHVGHLIYKSAIKEFLMNKIVILATHQIHHLQNMNKIIVLKEVIPCLDNPIILYISSFIEQHMQGKIEMMSNLNGLEMNSYFREGTRDIVEPKLTIDGVQSISKKTDKQKGLEPDLINDYEDKYVAFLHSIPLKEKLKELQPSSCQSVKFMAIRNVLIFIQRN